jgi:hypothetical protein
LRESGHVVVTGQPAGSSFRGATEH